MIKPCDAVDFFLQGKLNKKFENKHVTLSTNDELHVK